MIPKENLDLNRERLDKNKLSQNFIEDTRIFGKDLKNAQNNSLLPQQMKASYVEKMSNKNVNINLKTKQVFKEKLDYKTQLNSSLSLNISQEESQSKFIKSKGDKNESNEEAESLSQIIINQSTRELSDSIHYKDLSLVNENLFKKTEFQNQKIDEKEMIKIGNYYVKKSAFVQLNKTNKISQNQPNAMDMKISAQSKEDRNLEECDRLVKNNPQYTTEYVKDIFLHLKKDEHINASKLDYMSILQDDINEKMRAVLIDWIIEVHQKFKLESETLYLTVNLIDSYLSVQRIDRSKLQLIAVSAMLLASKYEEIYAPEVRDFVYITDKTYTKEEIIKMEYKMLSSLNFDILCVSPLTFLKRYHFVSRDSIRSFYLAQFILEFSFVEYKLRLYPASIKAAACLFISRRLLKIEKAWNESLAAASQYEDMDIKPCVKDLCKILELLPRINLKAAVNKFSTGKFMEVSKINMFN